MFKVISTGSLSIDGKKESYQRIAHGAKNILDIIIIENKLAII